MLEMQILQSIIEQERVGFHFVDREKPALYPVLIDEHDHVFQVVRQHVGLVSRGQRIEQERFAIGDNAWRAADLAAEALPTNFRRRVAAHSCNRG